MLLGLPTPLIPINMIGMRGDWSSFYTLYNANNIDLPHLAVTGRRNSTTHCYS